MLDGIPNGTVVHQNGDAPTPDALKISADSVPSVSIHTLH